jgi:hypothetical protein
MTPPCLPALIPLPRGWATEAKSGYLKLTIDYQLVTTSGILGLLEAWARGGRYHAACGDWSLAASRADFARALAQGDAELERQVRQNLFHFVMSIRFLAIDIELLDGLEDEAAARYPRLHALISGDGDEEAVDLLVRGLHPEHRRQVARHARRLGGRVFRRQA